MKPTHLLGLLLLLGLSVAGFFVFGGHELARPPQGDQAPPVEQASPANTGTGSFPDAAAPAAIDRQAALPDQTSPATERASTYPQGLRGIATDERGRPLAGIDVYLVESLRNEPLLLPTLLQQGLPLGPLAATRSGPDGSFAVGLQVPTEKLYELRLLSPRHARVRLGDLRVLPGEWHDVGAVILEPGRSIRGRVTIAGTETPVPQAVVTLSSGSVFDDVALRALPGFEHGHVAAVDAQGYYELTQAPTRGLFQLSAVAPGFARSLKQGIELGTGDAAATATDGPVVVDFGLLPGLAITGLVVDAGGTAVPQARLEAWPQAAATPPAVAMSGADGRFELLGLVAGEYRVRVLARGFLDQERRNVPAGSDDLRLMLEPRSRLRVRVLGADRQVLRRYQLGVRRWFPHASDALLGQIGLVAELPDQRVRLDGMTDAAEVPGLPPGMFVLEVNGEGHAKTLSAPFTLDANGQELELTVQLDRGGRLRGRVVDENGRPLAGATVESQPHGASPDNPVWRMLAQAAPERITRSKAVSGADGSFELPLLARGHYQLQIDHADACRLVQTDLRIEAAGDLELPVLRLLRGAEVVGSVRWDGKVPNQAKVVLATAVEPEAAPAGGEPGQLPATPPGLRLETVTDATGSFRLPRRVPPGRYEIRAATVGTGDPDAQVFAMIQQMQRSATTFQIHPGQAEVELRLELRSND